MSSAFPIIQGPSGGDGYAPPYISGISYQAGTVVVRELESLQANTGTSINFVPSQWDIVGDGVVSGATLNNSTAILNLHLTHSLQDVTVDLSPLSGGTAVPANLQDVTDVGNTTTNAITGTTFYGSVVGNVTGNLTGLANNSTCLGGQVAANYLRSDVADTKTSGNLGFSDNVCATFGSDSDMLITHNGTDACISNATGVLNIRNTGGIMKLQTVIGEEGVVLTPNGCVSMFYDNAEKLKTLTNGACTVGSHYATTFCGALNGNATTSTTANNSTCLGGQVAANYLRSNTSDQFTSGTFTFNSGTTTCFARTTGVAPFDVASTSLVTNLNADKVDSLDASSFLRADACDVKWTGDLYMSTNYLRFGSSTGIGTMWLKGDSINSCIGHAGTGSLFVGTGTPLSGPTHIVGKGQGNICVTDKEVAIQYCSGHKITTRIDGAAICGKLCVVTCGVAPGIISAEVCGTAPDWVATSDARLKYNFEDIEDPIELTMGLCGKKFDMHGTTDRQIGFVAQEIEKILPEVVSETKVEGGYYKVLGMDTVKGIKYDKIIPVLAEAIKVQQRTIKKLDERITQLENLNK